MTKCALCLLTFICAALKMMAQDIFPSSDYLYQPYGVCTHISRTDCEWNYIDRNLKLCKELDIDWIRTDFDKRTWLGAQKKILSDNLLKCKSNSISLLPILSRNLEDDAQYDSYVKGLVDSSNGMAYYWEVMNEVDLMSGEGEENSRKYVEQLKKIYSTIKSVNRANQIVYSGLAGLNNGFFEQTCKLGAYDYFDVMNFHCYASPEDMHGQLNRLKSYMKKYGWKKTVWLTETGISSLPHKNFYSELLPVAYKLLGIDPRKSKLGIVYDSVLPDVIDYAEYLYGKFSEIRYIKADELYKVSPKDVQVLLPSGGEVFPLKAYKGLVLYVKTGGTIICPKGVPFYYKEVNDGKLIQADGGLWKNLHMSVLYSWLPEAKKMGADVVPTNYTSDYGLTYPKSLTIEKARYVTTSNLQGGDRYISLVDASNGRFKGSIAGVYRLNSDMKGGIIVNTYMEKMPLSEELQALWLPRTYLIAFANGVERVFYYKMRAYERSIDREEFYGLVHKDFQPKMAYWAYKTLTKMCPSGSTRPILSEKGGVYCSSWKRNDGLYVSAYWARKYERQLLLSSPDVSVIDYMGKNINVSDGVVNVGAGVVYVLSKSPYLNYKVLN